MAGLGTIINVAAIVAGGVAGHFGGKLLKEKHQQSLTMACGISVMFIAIAGAMEGMLMVKDTSVISGGAMLLTLCLCLGALVGEVIDFEGLFKRFGVWLRQKSGNGGDTSFVDAFLTSSFTVSIGAMAVVGAIEDGLNGDFSILATKSVLDFVIVMILTCSMGKGSVFSAIPVAIIEGGMTLLSVLLRPLMTEKALLNLSLTGSVLIFCVGINLVFGKKVKVANMLPALIFAVIAAFLPI